MTLKAKRVHGRGFTLLETLLVLALIVAIFALAIPALRGPMETAKLRSAVELMRGEFAKARVEAMKSGRIQMLRCQRAGRDYQRVAWDAGEVADTPPASEVRVREVQAFDARDESDDLFGADTEQLPEEIEFFALSVDEDLRGAQLLADPSNSTSNLTVGEYLRPILFYADGTTSTVQLVLKNSRNRAVAINLRGLTGTVRITDVTSLAEAAE